MTPRASDYAHGLWTPKEPAVSTARIVFRQFLPHFRHSRLAHQWRRAGYRKRHHPSHCQHRCLCQPKRCRGKQIAEQKAKKMPSSYGRRDSLVYQASIERGRNEGIRRQNTITRRNELSRQVSFKDVIEKLNDDGVDLIKSTKNDSVMRVAVIMNCLADSNGVLVSVVQKFAGAGIVLRHLETRPDAAHHGEELELLCEVETKKIVLLNTLEHLPLDKIERIELRACESTHALPRPWVPVHVSELDQCAHVVVKYEPTEDPKHPGFGDQTYIERRAQLNAIANGYRHGMPFPEIEYTEQEHETWRQAYRSLRQLRESHTCLEYQRNVRLMEEADLITPHRIPSLRALSIYIQRKTGFQLRPCGGLLSARDFLASLAFRVFQTTLYTRHHSKPHHCPEPDVIHEILGHCAMFADPEMAQLSQEIGLLSLGASDEQIERLATLYWFTIEFGLCEQEGRLKAIGAGLISAFGELQHACSDVPAHEPFEPAVTALRTYEDSDYQPLYVVCKSIRDAMDKLRAYAKQLQRPTITLYDPYSQCVRHLSQRQYAHQKLLEVQKDMELLAESLNRSNLTES